MDENFLLSKKALRVSIIAFVIGLLLTGYQIYSYLTFEVVDAKVVDFYVHKSQNNKRGNNYEVLEYEYNGKVYKENRKVIFRKANSKDVGKTKEIRINPNKPTKILNHTHLVVFVVLDITSIIFIVIIRKSLKKDE